MVSPTNNCNSSIKIIRNISLNKLIYMYVKHKMVDNNRSSFK